jgi:ankyrin repeat protein
MIIHYYYLLPPQTPLHIASRLGNVDNVVLLLQHGASADATTKDLYSPLHIAAKEGHDEVTAVLLEHGSSQELTTKVRTTITIPFSPTKIQSLHMLYNIPVCSLIVWP